MSFRYQIRFNNTTTPFAEPLGFDSSAGRPVTHGYRFHSHLFTPTLLVELRSDSAAPGRPEQHLGGSSVADRPARLHARQGSDRLSIVQCYGLRPARQGANEPVQFAVTDISTRRNLQVKARPHEVGLRYDRTRFNMPYFNNNRGTFNFTGSVSGAPLSDFVLGQLNAATVAGTATTCVRPPWGDTSPMTLRCGQTS